MKRLVVLPLLFIASLSLATPPEELLKKRYVEYNKNILHSDSRAMTKWLNAYCTGAFSYTSYQKNSYKRGDYINGVLQQISQTNKVLKSTVTVRSMAKKGKSIVATVASDFKAIVVIDSRQLTLTDQSVTLETWESKNNDWKLIKVVQVNADTQMHENEG